MARSSSGSDQGAGPSTTTRLAILFLTVFVDLVGFGIVLPLLPFYADRFGASGLEIGLLVTVYSLAQLLLAPLWGRLSDHLGRRPILLVGLVGSAISYVVFAYAGSLLVLFVSRIMAGVGGANVSVAQAYIADVTPPEQRAGNMGLIGAAFGLGFIFGPALGGLLAPVSWEAPGLAAAALCFGNAFLAFFLLPESLPEDDAAPEEYSAVPVRLEDLRVALTSPRLLRILGLSFFFTVAFSCMQPTFPLFGEIRFGLDERTVGYLFAFLGLISAIMQGGLVRRLVPRLGEATLIRACAFPFVGGLVLIAVAPSMPVLLTGLAALAVGFGGTLPSIHSLVSRVAPDELQGSVLGVGQSVGALARVVGPVVAGWSFDVLGVASPYLVAAGIGGVALLFALTVHQPEPGEGKPGLGTTAVPTP
ncbi:MAG: MFS transporter [Gemmatimonadetes bacterium]|nr:MFS transporter [Gemmatimonadota bacterium]NIR77074.1 MFS transporter [Gemmatimonadota bacterium]NIW62491.1 MFS transporter [Gemmatimonadota bacterium]